MISSSFGTWTVRWPWPQIRYGHGNIVALARADWGLCQGEAADGNDSLVAFEVYFEEGVLYALPAIQVYYSASKVESVDFASFGDFYVLTAYILDNEALSVKTFVRDTTEDLGLDSLSEITGAPAALTVCNFNQQVLLGGLSTVDTKWAHLGLTGVVWSGIGNAVFDPASDPTAGMTQVRTARRGEGVVYKLLRFNKGVIVYSNAGCQALVPFANDYTTGFGESLMSFPGVSSTNHVAGDELRHLAIGADKNLWMLTEEKGLLKLGYKEFLMPMLQAGKVIVSYLPQRKIFYVSNETKSYMLNEFGLCEIHQSVTSVIEINGFLTGFFKDLGDYSAEVMVGDVDFDLGGFKTLETVDVSARVSGSPLSVGCDFLTDQAAASWRSAAFKTVNPQGFCFPMLTAQLFRPRVKITDYRLLSSDFALSNLKLRFKLSDKRGIRGKYVG